MRAWLAIGLILVAVLAAGSFSFASRQATAQAARPNIYDDLRAQALRTSPAKLGLTLEPHRSTAYGVVMDMGLKQGTATLVAYSTGDASLYLSSGGGIIGGGGHTEVRDAARAWLQGVQDHLTAFSPTTSFERPSDGQARFFVLTNDGVLTATVPEEQVNGGALPLSPVWYAGQRLLTELRQSTAKTTN